jgi:hypothetical protein
VTETFLALDKAGIRVDAAAARATAPATRKGERAMRTTLAMLATAAVGLVPPAADAVGTYCFTGRPDLYAGCTMVIVVPGTYCYVWSVGSVAGTPYAVGPYRC